MVYNNEINQFQSSALASSAPEPTFMEQNSQNIFKRESVSKIGNARYSNEEEEHEHQH